MTDDERLIAAWRRIAHNDPGLSAPVVRMGRETLADLIAAFDRRVEAAVREVADNG